MKTESPTGFQARLKRALRMNGLPPRVRRWVIGVIGGTVLLIGLALTVLPGPAFIVIPLGLAILASEFAWAKRYLDKAKGIFKKGGKKKAARPADRDSVTARG